MPQITDLQDYMVLSATINYQLTATPVNWQAVLSLARDDPYPQPDDEALTSILEYLHEAYGNSTRRLGPLAVLHPIRTAALLLRTVPDPPLADLVTALLHDKEEDLTEDRYLPEVWCDLEASYQEKLELLDPTWRMRARIEALTRRTGEDYFAYLGRVLDAAVEIPELVRIKLADRLDNTLDMSVDIRSATKDIDCFELVFDVLFTSSHLGQRLPLKHPVTGRINGSRRLYQLYKNAIFLSILRQRRMDHIGIPAQRLFQALAHWSLRQARQVLVHVFMFHVTSHDEQRRLLAAAMAYCQEGRIGKVLPGSAPHRLDGVFQDVFNISERPRLNAALDTLYADKPMMALVAIAMVATFSSFRNDPAFYIEGIDTAGLHARTDA
ncbi:MAG: hypothetical protein ABIO70_11065 [Pseudomonadota bacterium]